MKLTIENAPLGTFAPAIGGGHWIKTNGGWKWCNGATFETLGDDWTGELLAPDQSAPVQEPVGYFVWATGCAGGHWKQVGTAAEPKDKSPISRPFYEKPPIPPDVAELVECAKRVLRNKKEDGSWFVLTVDLRELEAALAKHGGQS